MNIGNGYREKFGNPEDFFGKSVLRDVNRQSSSPNLINRGFQFALKYLFLRGILIDRLWYNKEAGIKLLDELYYHFDIINSPNFGIGYNVKSGSINATEGDSVDLINSNLAEDSIIDYIFPFNPAARVVIPDFDPLLLDPVVSSYSIGSSSSSIALDTVVEQPSVVDQIDDFLFSNRKCRKVKACVQGCFEIAVSNKFDCLSSKSDFDSSDIDGGLLFYL